MRPIFGILRILTFSFLLICLAGCAHGPSESSNNHKTIPDLIHYFEKSNVTIDTLALLRRDVINADDAMAIKISGSEIGIYKFNDHIKKQREKLASISAKGYVYLIGIKKTAVVNGSFVMVDSDINKKRELIEKVFREFR